MTEFECLPGVDLPPEPSWMYDSLAVVASDEDGVGCVLWTVGRHVASMMEDCGNNLEALNLHEGPCGISIWEGRIHTTEIHTPDAHEYDSELRGRYRAPTDAEWQAIREGRCPWDEFPSEAP